LGWWVGLVFVGWVCWVAYVVGWVGLVGVSWLGWLGWLWLGWLGWCLHGLDEPSRKPCGKQFSTQRLANLL